MLKTDETAAVAVGSVTGITASVLLTRPTQIQLSHHNLAHHQIQHQPHHHHHHHLQQHHQHQHSNQRFHNSLAPGGDCEADSLLDGMLDDINELRQSMRNQHHHRHHQQQHQHLGHLVDEDGDDGDDVLLPEVNFNAADEFNLRFFDSSGDGAADEHCFSGDDDDGDEPDSFDSNAAVAEDSPSKMVAMTIHPSVSMANSTATALTADSKATTKLSPTSTSSSASDVLGDWMDSLVRDPIDSEGRAGTDHGMHVNSDFAYNNVSFKSGETKSVVDCVDICWQHDRMDTTTSATTQQLADESGSGGGRRSFADANTNRLTVGGMLSN